MSYLLDTNACIRILNNSSASVVDRFAQEAPDTIRLCSVVKAELLYGARKSRRVADGCATRRVAATGARRSDKSRRTKRERAHHTRFLATAAPFRA